MPTLTLKSRANRRLTPTLFLFTGLALLCGCHALTPEQRMDAWIDSGGKSSPTFLSAEEIKQLEARRYISTLSTTLADRTFRANGEGTQGSVKLRMKLNRQGDVLLCEVLPTDGDTHTDFARIVSDMCWSGVWDAIPEGLQKPADGSLEIVAPLTTVGAAPLTPEYHLRLQRSASASRFFWDNVVAKHAPNAFGTARFDVAADAQGKVLRCDVTLESNAFRPEYFQPDPELQKALATQCAQLDLRQMPGFRVGEDGLAKRAVFVDYLPWKHHVGQYQSNVATDKAPSR